jgi:hypothetical protein
MTKVVHCKKEEYDVYIGRPSKWGNPFPIGKDGTRDQVCDKYEEWFQSQDELKSSLHELVGKDLGCWCKPERCHGDYLLKLANELGKGMAEKQTKKCVIFGSRLFEDYSKIDDAIKKSKFDIEEIVYSDSKGADQLVAKYAKQHGFKTNVFKTDWDDIDCPGAKVKVNASGKKYNATAIFMKNEKISMYVDCAICLEEHPDCNDLLDKLKKMEVPVYIYGKGKARKVYEF